MSDEQLNPEQTANLLGITVNCLNVWRTRGKGPLFTANPVKGKGFRYTYSREEVERYKEINQKKSKSEILQDRRIQIEVSFQKRLNSIAPNHPLIVELSAIEDLLIQAWTRIRGLADQQQKEQPCEEDII